MSIIQRLSGLARSRLLAAGRRAPDRSGGGGETGIGGIYEKQMMNSKRLGLGGSGWVMGFRPLMRSGISPLGNLAELDAG
jgi:hypothetical protein